MITGKAVVSLPLVAVVTAALSAGGAVAPALAGAHSPRAGHDGLVATQREVIAYIANTHFRPGQGNGARVTPVNTATNKPGKPIKAGYSPYAVAITPNGETAYVADNGENNGSHVAPIATVTNKPGKSIKIGTEADYIAVTPDGKTVYVTDPTGGTVTAIATATNTAIARIKVGGYPTDITFGP